MTYADKLKDPRWQKKRLQILERDNWTCKSCNRKDLTLHVHHLRYFDWLEPWEYPDYTLITYCELCHNTEHLIGGAVNQSLLEIIERNNLLIKPVAQLCVLSENSPVFYERLKDFLNKELIEYNKSKVNG